MEARPAPQPDRYLGPRRGEPLGAGSLEAGRAALRLVALVAAALWKLFEHAAFQAGAHDLALTQPAAAGGIALSHSKTHQTAGK